MIDLARPLRAAIETALAAGDLLRRETWRADGPRGYDDKADADVEAEDLIRTRLMDAFPQWSFWGEETPPRTAAETSTFWLVDPNDGTRAYLRGFRGSAVSIALIHEGRPVLGVVHAPCYPDDSGDLIAWAEGCGPLQRNGKALDLPAFPLTLDSRHIVLVSQDADRKPTPNLRCCAPARYRALPSIAYRLALVAVGEAEVSVSLAGPGWLDVAGGHALVRARGGTLVDRHGATPSYDYFGNETLKRCFGGAPALCEELRQRPWGEVFHASPEAHGPLLFPVPPTPVRPPQDPRRLSRAHGVLLGQLAGDALGSRVEFLEPQRIRELHGKGPRDLADGGTFNTLAGQPTDDSELALALARSVIAQGRYEKDDVFAAYQTWFHSHPFDIGTTTTAALSRRSHRDSGTSATSQSNGSLMRISPLGVVAAVKRDAVGWARTDSGLTHPHPACEESCAVFVEAIAAGLAGASRQEMYRAALEASTLLTREALERAAVAPPPQFTRSMGWVMIALHNAFYRLLHADSMEDAIVDTVREGGDTDTNAAIAGALLGAHFGREGVPDRWLRPLLSCRPHAAHPAAQRPRPSWCWPVDVLETAERLLET